jgi:hypothetical protein
MPAIGLRAVSVAVATVVLSSLGWVSVSAPASAEPPVARNDHRIMYAGDGRSIDVLRNDSDPDGDELALCRVQETETDEYLVFIDGNRLYVFLTGSADEVTITYYACDFETLVPATLTITVKETFRPKVTKLDRPGRLRVTNDNDKIMRFLWGSFDEDRPDGRVRVDPHDSVVIRVHRHKIDWIAFLKNGVFLGIGHVRDIDLPDRASSTERARITLTEREAKVWARQG